MDKINGWVDIHAHFTPPTTTEAREAQWRQLRDTHLLAPEPHHWQPETTLATMDRLGIATQMLSPALPVDAPLPQLRAWNDYGAQLVADHPGRFGLLAVLPTDDPDAALAEIARGDTKTHPDGYMLFTRRAGVPLGDPRLAPMWEELDRRSAVLFVHPSPVPPAFRQTAVLVEFPFETTRTVVDLLYTGFFRRYPRLTVVLAHCGGALPALSGRLGLLGAEEYVFNPLGLTADDIRTDLAKLYLDTAAAGTDANLAAAVTMVPRDHIVYGADAGVPCSNEDNMKRNIDALRNSHVLAPQEVDALGHRAFDLFPAAAQRHRDAIAAAV
ncbi:amidohydrolase family protein [Streptomyces canus]|uniref:amidohydrolase family protein n=1 Tax=Streptomyces canus TaxID=58343 RepID=UPI0036B04368